MVPCCLPPPGSAQTSPHSEPQPLARSLEAAGRELSRWHLVFRRSAAAPYTPKIPRPPTPPPAPLPPTIAFVFPRGTSAGQARRQRPASLRIRNRKRPHRLRYILETKLSQRLKTTSKACSESGRAPSPKCKRRPAPRQSAAAPQTFTPSPIKSCP